EGDERALTRGGHDLEALGEQLAAARGGVGGPLVSPLGRGLEGGREAGQERRRRPARVEARRPWARGELAIRLVLLLRQVARRRDSESIGVGDGEPAGPIRAAGPFLAGEGVEVEARGVDGDRARRLGAVDEQRQARLLLQLV